MALITSVSGLRGTIGGRPGENLTPVDLVGFTSAYAQWARRQGPAEKKIVLARDARPTGPAIAALVSGVLNLCGFDVMDIGSVPTPTAACAVRRHNAAGAVVVTASHNPAPWNALKLFNAAGECLSPSQVEEFLKMLKKAEFDYPEHHLVGHTRFYDRALEEHIEAIAALEFVDAEAIRAAGFRVAFDGINSVGGPALHALLSRLGVAEIEGLNHQPTGVFAHAPEPLPENLYQLAKRVRETHADVGFAVDPDADRLVIFDERGECFGEEYTLVSLCDFRLKYGPQREPTTLVSNLSSTRALRDLAQEKNVEYQPAAVGEANVVEKMKTYRALIGGEGNGGVIVPELNYGRDALVGVAMFLTFLSKERATVSSLKNRYSDYKMFKHKVDISSADVEPKLVLARAVKMLAKKDDMSIDTSDGLKVDYPDKWVHMRLSNTEPIVRIYTEAREAETAKNLALEYENLLKKALIR
jgi:phosphomannomutase